MRIVVADPPAFTPPDDHELAAALARAGAEVELLTSRFRFGDAPSPVGYRRSESLYPLSSRLFRRSRLRLPVKAAEHLLVMRALRRLRPDVVHLEQGRETLAELGVDARVIPHPVFPSDPTRADDGATALCLGLIRPYKGLADAIEAVRRVDGARLL